MLPSRSLRPRLPLFATLSQLLFHASSGANITCSYVPQDGALHSFEVADLSGSPGPLSRFLGGAQATLVVNVASF